MFNIFEVKEKWHPDVYSGSVMVKSGKNIISPVLCGSLKDIVKTLSLVAVHCTTCEYEDAMAFVNKAYECISTQEYPDCSDDDVSILYFEIENQEVANAFLQGSDDGLLNCYVAAIEILSEIADFEYVVAAIKIELRHQTASKKDFNMF